MTVVHGTDPMVLDGSGFSVGDLVAPANLLKFFERYLLFFTYSSARKWR